MGFKFAKSSICLNDIKEKFTEEQIATFILGVYKFPCLINSPLREDNKPSFGLFISDTNNKVYFTDFATGEKGNLYTLLQKMWNLPYQKTIEKLWNELNKAVEEKKIKVSKGRKPKSNNQTIKIEVKIRDWAPYDIEYWKEYGISLKWLKYAEVYPISHTFVTKNGIVYTFSTEKYAYAFIERKEGKVTTKVYRPFNKEGFKWLNSHDSSVISLWTKIPNTGEKLCICSSLKDALCLSANTGIPAIAMQSETTAISKTAQEELKKRYKKIYIMFDIDPPGIEDGKKFAENTGFTNIIMPNINGTKDISDLYKSLEDKTKFKQIILPLFI